MYLAQIEQLMKAAGPIHRRSAEALMEKAVMQAAEALGLDFAEIDRKAVEACKFDGGPVIYWP